MIIHLVTREPSPTAPGTTALAAKQVFQSSGGYHMELLAGYVKVTHPNWQDGLSVNVPLSNILTWTWKSPAARGKK